MPHLAVALVLAASALLQIASSNALGALGQGNQLMAAERYDEAAAQFKQALNDNPVLQEARLNLAICNFQLRNYTAAAAIFQKLKPNAVPTYYLGRIHLINGNYNAAIANFRASGNTSDGHGNLLDSTYFLGLTYFKKGSYTDAVAALQKWIAINPRDFRAHEILARALQKTGHPAEAAAEFQLTRNLHDYYTEGSVKIGECRDLLNRNRAPEAWSKCSSILSSDDPDKVAALALTFGQAGDQDHAAYAWRKAVALDPDSPELNYNLSFACFNLRDLACAKQHAAKAVLLWPRFPEANVLYGTVLYMLAEDSAATQVLTLAQQLRPDDANVTRLLADLRSRQN